MSFEKRRKSLIVSGFRSSLYVSFASSGFISGFPDDLQLENNRLTGTIPPELSGCKKLRKYS